MEQQKAWLTPEQLKLRQERIANFNKFLDQINLLDCKSFMISTMNESGMINSFKCGNEIEILAMAEVFTTAVKLKFLGFSPQMVGEKAQ